MFDTVFEKDIRKKDNFLDQTNNRNNGGDSPPDSPGAPPPPPIDFDPYASDDNDNPFNVDLNALERHTLLGIYL